MAREPFELAGTLIEPGERATVGIPLPHQPSYTPMTMPVHVVHGKREGPALFISAAIHGDEINGVEIVRRVLAAKSIGRLRGTLLCVPIVNVFGFLTHSRYLPDRRDLNRSFPGSPHGSMASRLAHVFGEEIVKKCAFGIDLHTGSSHRMNHPHIRANLDDGETKMLAEEFGTPVIINANLRDGSLRQFASELGIPMLLYEAGEALRFDALAIKAGVTGIHRVMRAIGMLPARTRKPRPRNVLIAKSSSWVRAPQSGIFRPSVALGARVRKEDTLGIVSDPIGTNEMSISSGITGIVVGYTRLPIINEGDALFHIARFEDSKSVEAAIEAFHEEHIEGLGQGDYTEVME